MEILVEKVPAVSSEIFDDEVVIVNLENGNYYSYNQSGVDIWSALKNGISKDDLVIQFEKKYAFSAEQVEEFNVGIQQLIDEELVGTVEGAESTTVDFTRENYTSPELTKHSDMQDLLLLDPIHDVNETGWPLPKEDSDQDKAEEKKG